jgi:hypothetical protein
MAEGADVIFGAGGQTGSGGIQAAAEAGAFVIGVDQDEYVTTFQNGAAPGSDKIISSAMKRVDQAVFLTIKDVVDGKFTNGVAVYDATNGGIGLAYPSRSQGQDGRDPQGLVRRFNHHRRNPQLVFVVIATTVAHLGGRRFLLSTHHAIHQCTHVDRFRHTLAPCLSIITNTCNTLCPPHHRQ